MENRAQIVYMTASSKEEATQIGQCLVDENLAACVNIIDGMTSIFRWEGEVNSSTEVILIAKSTSSNIDALTKRVKLLHSYDCPCIVSLPIVGGNPEFLDWIEGQVN